MSISAQKQCVSLNYSLNNYLTLAWSRKSRVPILLNTLIGSEGAGQVQNTVISLMNQNNAKLFRNVWPENDSRKNLKDL